MRKTFLMKNRKKSIKKSSAGGRVGCVDASCLMDIAQKGKKNFLQNSVIKNNFFCE